jgi:hypothetical protein
LASFLAARIEAAIRITRLVVPQVEIFDYDFNQVAEDAMMTGEYDDTYEADDLPAPEPTKK